jgi:hypothetical protein
MVGINKSCLLLALSLSIQAAAALSATSSKSSNNVIFVGGLCEDVDSAKLSKEFERYGNVVDVSIIGGGKKQKPYAFVQFETPQSAQAAILESTPSSLFRQVKAAQPIDTSKRKRSNTSRQKQEAELELIKDVCSRTNLVLQVQSTHIDRIKDFLTNYISENESIELAIQGQSSSSITKNASLVFVSTSSPESLANALSKSEYLQFIARAVKKLYIVQPGAIQADISTEEGCDVVVKDLIQNKILYQYVESVRLQIFPPSCQGKVIAAVEALDSNGLATKLNPRDATDTISIVQVHKHKGRSSDTTNDALVMCGVSKSILDSSIQLDSPQNGQEAVSQAYFKIKEAISRYERERVNFSMESYRDCIAIDCGSAPGGWTKYLAQDAKLRLVHSVDPGDLLTMDVYNVNHMRMKIQDAIPRLKSEMELDVDEDKIKVFVSDACLHSMSAQADFLLDAKERGILADEVFFVLTLKCTIGHGKSNFDAQVEQAVRNLKHRAEIRDLSVYHLFSNRIGVYTDLTFSIFKSLPSCFPLRLREIFPCLSDLTHRASPLDRKGPFSFLKPGLLRRSFRQI